MLCCSLIAVLLGQGGALAGAAKVRLFGGAGAVSAALGPVVAGWSGVRWLVLGTALAGELGLSAFLLPRFFAIDSAQTALRDWPICVAVRALTNGGHQRPRT